MKNVLDQSIAPRVSVIMPCYNHAAFVSQSVAAILGQTFRDFELIVVDDKSGDASVEILQKIAGTDSRLKLIIHSRNQGASRSRNDGLREARGEFIAFCDADDLWKSDKLARQIQILTEHKQCDLTYCDSQIIDVQGIPTGELFSDQFPVPPAPADNLFEALSIRNFINMTTVLARRQALGPRLFFDDNIKWVEDWWQWIRLSYHHRFCYDPAVLAEYRVHPQSTGFTRKPGINRNRWKVGRRNLQAHGDMPLQLQALIWYQMGKQLCGLGKKRWGCRLLVHALYCAWKARMAWRQLIKMTARAGLEFIK